MDGPAEVESELAAPRWSRWSGVGLCGLAALVVAFTAHGDKRTAGFAVAGGAAFVWVVAVVLGAIKVKRRDQEIRRWVVMTRLVITFVVGFAIVDAVPALYPRPGLLQGADLLSALLCGGALGCITTWAIDRSRQQD